MDIQHVKENEISIITINGRLDGVSAPVAEKTIEKILIGTLAHSGQIGKCRRQ